jgi:hypothetical protein
VRRAVVPALAKHAGGGHDLSELAGGPGYRRIANGAPHSNGNDKIDKFFGPESTATMQASLLSDLATNNFEYTFVHYADLDDAGHSAGWGSATYMSAIVTVDNYLGQVFNLIETDPDLAGRTAIVLSADHGGTGTGHSTASNASNYTIPFYAWGAGVAHGDLYAFNLNTRTDPLTGRPDYNALSQPIRNGDGGNLALSLLGLGSIPGSMIKFRAKSSSCISGPGTTGSRLGNCGFRRTLVECSQPLAAAASIIAG